jgi:mannose-1-phosphate guanylyltransferase
MALHAVIMAGGSGTRFWPASREQRPKQLLRLAGSQDTLLAATVKRIAPLVPNERVWVVTAGRLLQETRDAAPALMPAHILGEPKARNTAPCVAWATAAILEEDADATIIVLPSDHHIADEPAFLAALAEATTAAESGYVTTLGIVPTRPETGYGYIEFGTSIGSAKSVKRFVEKPQLDVARSYVDAGNYLWNAGMFIFRASVMRDEIAEHMPDLAAGVTRMLSATDPARRALAIAEVFPTLPSISIDVGVMERCTRIAVVPADIGWNDVGSWESAWELASKDSDGNSLRGNALCIAGANNLVWDLRTAPHSAVLAVVGLRNMVVVFTDDAVAVLPREFAQDVRKIVEALRARGDSAFL